MKQAKFEQVFTWRSFLSDHNHSFLHFLVKNNYDPDLAEATHAFVSLFLCSQLWWYERSRPKVDNEDLIISVEYFQKTIYQMGKSSLIHFLVCSDSIL